MPAPDRLAELRRQRAQIADHLAWLDREIAAEETAGGGTPPGALPAPVAPIGGSEATRTLGVKPPPPSSGTPSPGHVSSAPAPAQAAAAAVAGGDGATGTSAATAAAEAEALLEEYRVPAGDLKKDVRNGCLFYFAAALLALAGIVAVLYYVARR